MHSETSNNPYLIMVTSRSIWTVHNIKMDLSCHGFVSHMSILYKKKKKRFPTKSMGNSFTKKFSAIVFDKNLREESTCEIEKMEGRKAISGQRVRRFVQSCENKKYETRWEISNFHLQKTISEKKFYWINLLSLQQNKMEKWINVTDLDCSIRLSAMRSNQI